MNIVFASSEVVPFAKTGGLADVCGTLPKEIARLGHDTCAFLPAYRDVHQALDASGKAKLPIEPTGINLEIPVGGKTIYGRLLRSRLPQSNVPVFLIEQPDYFDRAGLYQENGRDYDDNCARFVFFCRAVIESIQQLDLQPDLIHVNDWQSSLIPAYLATEYAAIPRFENVATLLTIHNLAYQGLFWHWDMLLTGLDWKYFNWRQMEFFGQLSFLKTGIVFADAISTVSPTYAREIQTAEHGCGLESTLASRKANISGILNGIDDQWNPQTDPHIPANYDVSDWSIHKPKCKMALQNELGLADSGMPLIGLVGRLAEQKGWSLIVELLKHWLEDVDVQWAILGTGDPGYEYQLHQMAERWPHKIGLQLGFDNGMAHRIEAGADIFLMPSIYEPCGLNQMYSLRYGTIPVVRATGGLADTIVNVDVGSLQNRTANGFSFGPFSIEDMGSTLFQAVETFRREPEIWQQLVETAMNRDSSWSHSGHKYVELYEQTIAKRKAMGRQLV